MAGRMSTSAVKFSVSPSFSSVMSTSGWPSGVDLRLVDRLGVELRERVVDGLLQHGTAAEPLVDDPGRDLALAEALDRDLLVDLLVRRVEAVLELLEGHLDSEPNPGRVQGLHGALHGSVSLVADFWGSAESAATG